MCQPLNSKKKKTLATCFAHSCTWVGAVFVYMFLIPLPPYALHSFGPFFNLWNPGPRRQFIMMKYTTLTCLSMTRLVLAQSLSDLPSCATGCLDGAVRQVSTCATSDLVCICKTFDAIQGAAAGCVLGACGKEVALSMYMLLRASQNLPSPNDAELG